MNVLANAVSVVNAVANAVANATSAPASASATASASASTHAPPVPASADAIIISIEGNIGTGKSTLLETLKEKYAADPSIHFMAEPVDVWNTIVDGQGVTILEKYYANQQKYAFSFQMMAYISRIAAIRAALKKNYRIIILERSVYTDSAVFAKMLFHDQKIEDIEYMIYMKWVDEFISDLPPIKFIYMQANPEVSYERVLKRGRTGETIPLAYLQNCHKYHEEWLLVENTQPLLLLDANVDTTNEPGTLDDWLSSIEQFIKV
jgi:deoxyadenosine/deoxycytidine kinase